MTSGPKSAPSSLRTTLRLDSLESRDVPNGGPPMPLPPIPFGEFEAQLTEVASGLTAPLYLTQPNVNRPRFILDQDGQVYTLDAAGNRSLYLDVTNRLVGLTVYADERGLLGMAFHPNFDNPGSAGYGKFYLRTSEPAFNPNAADFTVDIPPNYAFDHQAVITEWSALDPATGALTTPTLVREIMRINEPQFNHNGGQILFGPDGYFYISLGDGGGGDDQDGQAFHGIITEGHGPIGNGQDLTTVLGKILRIDVNITSPINPANPLSRNGQYRIPVDNPFVANPNALDEIFAYGFRNPYRFSFAPDGTLIVGDVGQQTIEEINFVIPGGNYGWRLKEGKFVFDMRGIEPDQLGVVDPNNTSVPGVTLIDPVASYDHEEGAAVIGGFVYRGTAIPELQGKYIFADLFGVGHDRPRGRLFYADYDPNHAGPEQGLGPVKEFVIPGEFNYFIRGIGEDASGELYLEVSQSFYPADYVPQIAGGGKVFKLTGVRRDVPPPPLVGVPSPILVGGPPAGAIRVFASKGGDFPVVDSAFVFPGFTGPARVVSADVTGDRTADYIIGAGPGGGPVVVIIDGKSQKEIARFLPFPATFRGGVHVAAGDLDGDGYADVATAPGEGGGPVVAIYSGQKLTEGNNPEAAEMARFLGIDDPNFRGGARLAFGDVNHDGVPDLVVGAGVGGGPRVAIFNGKDILPGVDRPARLVADFFVFEPSLRDGVFVAAGDVDGDGFADLAFGGGPGGAPRVLIVSGKALLNAPPFTFLDQILPSLPELQTANLFAGDPARRGGVHVALQDVNGDGQADLTTGSGQDQPSEVRIYLAPTLRGGGSPNPDTILDPFGSVILPYGVFVG